MTSLQLELILALKTRLGYLLSVGKLETPSLHLFASDIDLNE